MNNKLENIITIDGAASTGKSTIASMLSNQLGYALFDSGSLYRAFCYYLIEKQVEMKPRAVFLALQEFKPTITSRGEILLNKRVINQYLRSTKVNDLVPLIGSAFFIRKRIQKIQRDFAIKHEGKVIVTGRDVGRDVFPESNFQFFLTADPRIRAQRRLKEALASGNTSATYESILEGIMSRDHKDSTRIVSPMGISQSAINIDTSMLTVEEVIDQINKIISEKNSSLEGQHRRSKEY